MTEEEKAIKAAMTTKVKEDVDANTDESEKDKKEEAIDYKVELEKEKLARKKAEEALAANAFKDRKSKRDEESEESEEEDEDKPLTHREMSELLERQTQKTRKELQVEIIRDLATKMADTPEEADYIIEIHKNRTFPSHLSLSEQLEESYAIANRKKLKSQNSELKRALGGKENASKDGEAGHRDGMRGSEPQLSAGDKIALKGFTWDATRGMFKKPVGKKNMYVSKDLKKRFVE